MTNLHLALSVLLVCSQFRLAIAFQPSLTKRTALTTALKSTEAEPRSAFYEYDPVSYIDLDYAHDCAEHFGKCELSELEDMRQALHTERVQHAAVGVTLDPVEELDHRLLEEDLSLQLKLLKDELNSVPPMHNYEKPAFDVAKSGGGAAVVTDPSYHHSDHTLRDYIEQGEELFLMPNGLADAAAFGMALIIISLAPFVLQ